MGRDEARSSAACEPPHAVDAERAVLGGAPPRALGAPRARGVRHVPPPERAVRWWSSPPSTAPKMAASSATSVARRSASAGPCDVGMT